MGEIAAKAVVQLLYATGKSFTVDGLREKLRELFRQEVRAVAALNNVELISALISFNRKLALIGLQLRLSSGPILLPHNPFDAKAAAGRSERYCRDLRRRLGRPAPPSREKSSRKSVSRI